LPAHSAVESRGEANGLFANLAKSHVIFFSSEHARRHLRHHFGKQVHWDGAKDEDAVLLIVGEGPATITRVEEAK
jgi:hypothetical protein